MCGIAGVINRKKTVNVGEQMRLMLQGLKHRGPDSTGYALYAENDGKNFIMRFKVGENVGEGSTSVNEDASVYDKRKKMVDQMLSELGAKVIKEDKKRATAILYNAITCIDASATMFTPFMPTSSEKVLQAIQKETDNNWSLNKIKKGAQIENIGHLFKKID